MDKIYELNDFVVFSSHKKIEGFRLQHKKSYYDIYAVEKIRVADSSPRKTHMRKALRTVTSNFQYFYVCIRT